VLLTMKEANRVRDLQGYMDGKILIDEAARTLKRSLRPVYRMVAKVRGKGPGGFTSGLPRNRPSPCPSILTPHPQSSTRVAPQPVRCF